KTRGGFDLRGRNAGDTLAPLRRAVIEPVLDLLPTERMPGEIGTVDQALAANDMKHGEGQSRVAAWERLQMQIGRSGRRVTHGIDDDLLGRRLGEPMLVRVRRRGRGIGAPDED